MSTAWSSHQQIKFESLKLGLKEFDLNELPTLSHPVVCVIDDEEPEKCATQSQGVAEASPLGSLDGAQVVVSQNFSFLVCVFFCFFELFIDKRVISCNLSRAVKQLTCLIMVRLQQTFLMNFKGTCMV